MLAEDRQCDGDARRYPCWSLAVEFEEERAGAARASHRIGITQCSARPSCAEHYVERARECPNLNL
jgi:hypothetical protein